MNQDEIIEMARQAGYDDIEQSGIYKFEDFDIEVFAKLVAEREWVGLTDEEKESLINKKVDGAYLTVMQTIELTEAKLKDKNI